MSKLFELLSASEPASPPSDPVTDLLSKTYFHDAKPPVRRRVLYFLYIGAVCGCLALFLVLTRWWQEERQARRLEAVGAAAHEVLVQDFDKRDGVDPLGRSVGVWLSRPSDASQNVVIALDRSEPLGGVGQSLRIAYDVDSEQSATVGVWMALPALPLSRVAAVELYMRGDPSGGYPEAMVLELRGEHSWARHVAHVSGRGWQRLEVPAEAFERWLPSDTCRELRVLFERGSVGERAGVVYIDDIRLKQRRS